MKCSLKKTNTKYSVINGFKIITSYVKVKIIVIVHIIFIVFTENF